MSIEPEDELDQLLDRALPTGELSELAPRWDGLRRLIAADAATEPADPEFLSGLRADLLRRHPERPARIDARSVGILAMPVPGDFGGARNRRLLAIVAAAAILLAVAGSGFRWGRDGHPRMNVATAQASIMPDPTPTVIATLTIAIGATQ